MTDQLVPEGVGRWGTAPYDTKMFDTITRRHWAKAAQKQYRVLAQEIDYIAGTNKQKSVPNTSTSNSFQYR